MLPRALYVCLKPFELQALGKVAEAERRHPRDQGALFIVEALRARGLLTTEADPDRESTSDEHS